MNRILRRVLFAVCLSALSAAFGPNAAAQNIAVKTNALMWAALTPNLGCEIVTGEHTSIELSAFGHKNPYGLTSEIIAVQPEFRYWFNGRPMIREFVGIGAVLTRYDMTIGQKILDGDLVRHMRQVYDGDAVGIGITGGYVFALGKRLNLELAGSFGLLFFRQKQYFEQDKYDDYYVAAPKKANSKGYKFFPVDLGVTFTYILK